MLLLLVAAAAMHAWQKGRRWRLMAVACALYPIVWLGGSILLQRPNVDALDSWSSGRWGIWRMIIDHNFQDAPSVVFGNGVTEWPGVRPEDIGVGVLHVDNVYLDMACSTGFFGVALFGWAVYMWWRRLGRSGAARTVGRPLLFGVLAAGLTDSLFPSLGNVANSYVVLAIVGVTVAGGAATGVSPSDAPIAAGKAVRRALEGK